MNKRRTLMALAAGLVLPRAGGGSPYPGPQPSHLREITATVATSPGSLTAASLGVDIALRATGPLLDRGLTPGVRLGYLSDAPLTGAIGDRDIAKTPDFLARPSNGAVLFRCEDDEVGLRLHAMLLERGQPFVQVRPDSIQNDAGVHELRARTTSFGFDVCFPTPWDQQLSAQFDAARGAEPDCGLSAFEAAGYPLQELISRRNAYHGHILASVLLAIWNEETLSGLSDRPLGRIKVSRRPDGSLSSAEVSLEGSATA